MYSLNGLVDGNSIKTQENLQAFEGCHVIITILDSPVEAFYQSEHNIANERRKAAARELSGLWATHDQHETVDEMVRKMRRGRKFDI